MHLLNPQAKPRTGATTQPPLNPRRPRDSGQPILQEHSGGQSPASASPLCPSGAPGKGHPFRTLHQLMPRPEASPGWALWPAVAYRCPGTRHSARPPTWAKVGLWLLGRDPHTCTPGTSKHKSSQGRAGQVMSWEVSEGGAGHAGSRGDLRRFSSGDRIEDRGGGCPQAVGGAVQLYLP